MTKEKEDPINPSLTIIQNRKLKEEEANYGGAFGCFHSLISSVRSKMSKEEESGIPLLSSKSKIRLQNLTGLGDKEIRLRRKEFYQNFPDGFVTNQEFQTISAKVLSNEEVDKFTENVFHLFDSDKDNKLSFEEFTIATSVNESEGPLEKLQWLFDHVYDKERSGKLSRYELEEILIALLKAENIKPHKAKDLVNDIFRELDDNVDGLITKEEFIRLASGSVLVWEILSSVADKERKKRRRAARKKKQPQSS